MNQHTTVKPEPVTVENVQARIAARNAFETSQLEALNEALTDLLGLRRLNLPPMNRNLLWAEWRFYKALNDWGASNDTDEWFDAACANLGVDAEGEAA